MNMGIRTTKRSCIRWGIGLSLVATVAIGASSGSQASDEDSLHGELFRQLDADYGRHDESRESWPMIQQVVAAVGEDVLRSDAYYDAVEAEPGDAHWDEALALYARHRTAVEVAVEAGRRERLGRPYSARALDVSWMEHFTTAGDIPRAWKYAVRVVRAEADPGPFPDISYMEFIDMLHVASLVRMSARVAEAEGDVRVAFERLDATAGLARQMVERGLVIERAIGTSLSVMAQRALRPFLVRHRATWDADELARFADSHICRLELATLEDTMECEWRMIEATAGAFFSDDGRGDGEILVGEAQAFLTSSVLSSEDFAEITSAHAGRRETLERIRKLYDASIRAAADPALATVISDLEGALEPTRHQLGKLCATDFSSTRVHDALARAHVEQEATVATIELLRFRAEHGTWPSSFAELMGITDPGATSLRFDGVIDGDMPRIVSSSYDLSSYP